MSTSTGNRENLDVAPDARKPIIPASTADPLALETGAPPPKRSRFARNRFVILLNFVISGIVLFILVAGMAFYLGKREFESAGPAKEATLFMVRRNTGVSSIADALERRNLISDARVFALGTRMHGNDASLKAGEYEIPANASMQDIMELFKSGRSVLYSLTVPEGYTVDQTFERIANHDILVGEMPADKPTEGMMIADTMRFTRGTTRKDIIKKMIADQQRLVESIWQRRADNLPVENINEFVTLASIVEKETAIADERSRVAAVFINRLKRGMRLQSDPTIIYGLFGGKGKPSDRPIYKSDIEKPTPYNTYTIDGLPPTPIANPGRASLEAVANPSRTADLYFVADGTGGHAFASTLKEHNENVARWRRIEKQRREEAEAAETGDVENRSE